MTSVTDIFPAKRYQERYGYWRPMIRSSIDKLLKCGGTMKIVSFIEEPPVIEKILRHCELWAEAPPRPPPLSSTITEPDVLEQVLDYGFTSTTLSVNWLSAGFESTCI